MLDGGHACVYSLRMIEIGKTRIVPVRTKSGGKLFTVYDEQDKPVTKVVASEVCRVTRETLGGNFGTDQNRRLVVSLKAGDILSLRPQGTRQEVTVALKDVYRWAIQARANRALLEKARAAKARKQELRIERKRAAEDRKLRRQIFAEQ